MRLFLGLDGGIFANAKGSDPFPLWSLMCSVTGARRIAYAHGSASVHVRVCCEIRWLSAHDVDDASRQSLTIMGDRVGRPPRSSICRVRNNSHSYGASRQTSATKEGVRYIPTICTQIGMEVAQLLLLDN